MAKRRAIALTIITSDAYLNMPAKAQALYIQLLIRADDDGFINNSRSIMAATSATTKELNILKEKKFLLEIEDIIIIKHWWIHNLKRPDRYTETIYKDIKKQLVLDNKDGYTYAPNMAQNGSQKNNQNGNQMVPQIKLNKIKLNKDKENEENIIYSLFNNYYEEDINDNIKSSISLLIKAYGTKNLLKALKQYTDKGLKLPDILTISAEARKIKQEEEGN